MTGEGRGRLRFCDTMPLSPKVDATCQRFPIPPHAQKGPRSLSRDKKGDSTGLANLNRKEKAPHLFGQGETSSNQGGETSQPPDSRAQLPSSRTREGVRHHAEQKKQGNGPGLFRKQKQNGRKELMILAHYNCLVGTLLVFVCASICVLISSRSRLASLQEGGRPPSTHAGLPCLSCSRYIIV